MKTWTTPLIVIVHLLRPNDVTQVLVTLTTRWQSLFTHRIYQNNCYESIKGKLFSLCESVIRHEGILPSETVLYHMKVAETLQETLFLV